MSQALPLEGQDGVRFLLGRMAETGTLPVLQDESYSCARRPMNHRCAMTSPEEPTECHQVTLRNSPPTRPERPRRRRGGSAAANRSPAILFLKTPYPQHLLGPSHTRRVQTGTQLFPSGVFERGSVFTGVPVPPQF